MSVGDVLGRDSATAAALHCARELSMKLPDGHAALFEVDPVVFTAMKPPLRFTTSACPLDAVHARPTSAISSRRGMDRGRSHRTTHVRTCDQRRALSIARSQPGPKLRLRVCKARWPAAAGSLSCRGQQLQCHCYDKVITLLQQLHE